MGRKPIGQHHGIRVSDEEWQTWYFASVAVLGGKRRMSEWIRQILNQAASDVEHGIVRVIPVKVPSLAELDARCADRDKKRAEYKAKGDAKRAEQTESTTSAVPSPSPTTSAVRMSCDKPARSSLQRDRT